MMDPRSTQGILSRGRNIYNSTGFSPFAGKPSIDLQATAKSLIPKTMDKIDYSKVAQQWLNQQSSA